MRKNVLLFMALLGLTTIAQAQVQVGVNVGGGGDSFYLALGNYYHAPPEQVTVCQQRHIPDEEMPVVFFLAQRAHVAPGVIVDLRAGGMPWFDIFRHYRVNPRVLYMRVPGNMGGTPYAGFYAYYHGGPNGRLVDADFVNMVNLRFATEYYHRTPAEVVRLRAGGHDYRYIHNQYWHPGPKAVRHEVREDRRDDRRMDRRDDRRDDRWDDRRDDHKDDRHDDRPGDDH